MTYKIEGTNSRFEVETRTSNYTDDSACDVIGSTSFSCQAEGLDVTFS